MRQYYVCAVLPPEDAVLGPPDSVTGRPVVVTPAKPQRAKVADLPGYTSYATDIPTDPSTGLTLKPWCVAAVSADAAVHDLIAADPEVRLIDKAAQVRAQVRVFLTQKGEVAPPDTPQGCLERSHPGARIEDLRAG